MGRPKGSKNKPKPPAPAETNAVAKPVDVAEHVRRINVLVEKLDNAESKVDQYQRSIGQHIAEIKKARPDDWKTIVETQCKLKKSRAYELLAIADGSKTLGQVRAATAERVREHAKRKKEKNPLANGQGERARAHTVSGGNGADPEAAAERRKREFAEMEKKADGVTGLERVDRKAAFLERCEQAIGFATYSGPVDNEVAGAAERVAAEWERQARELRGKVQDAQAFDSPAAQGNGSAPEASAGGADDLDPPLPTSCERKPKVTA
jgi:hypothetical protein